MVGAGTALPTDTPPSPPAASRTQLAVVCVWAYQRTLSPGRAGRDAGALRLVQTPSAREPGAPGSGARAGLHPIWNLNVLRRNCALTWWWRRLPGPFSKPSSMPPCCSSCVCTPTGCGWPLSSGACGCSRSRCCCGAWAGCAQTGGRARGYGRWRLCGERHHGARAAAVRAAAARLAAAHDHGRDGRHRRLVCRLQLAAAERPLSHCRIPATASAWSSQPCGPGTIGVPARPWPHHLRHSAAFGAVVGGFRPISVWKSAFRPGTPAAPARRLVPKRRTVLLLVDPVRIAGIGAVHEVDEERMRPQLHLDGHGAAGESAAAPAQDSLANAHGVRGGQAVQLQRAASASQSARGVGGLGWCMERSGSGCVGADATGASAASSERPAALLVHVLQRVRQGVAEGHRLVVAIHDAQLGLLGLGWNSFKS